MRKMKSWSAKDYLKYGALLVLFIAAMAVAVAGASMKTTHSL